MKNKKFLYILLFFSSFIVLASIASANESPKTIPIEKVGEDGESYTKYVSHEAVNILIYDEINVVVHEILGLENLQIKGNSISHDEGTHIGINPRHIIVPVTNELRVGDEIPQSLIDNYDPSKYIVYTEEELTEIVKTMEIKLAEYETKIIELEKTIGSIEELQNRVDNLEEKLPQTRRPTN
ncbi:hypothetical protein CR203_03715 [Salipaludibacillus neizhouensis]|uniref:DUF4140 domain-containing protein n=1 Tax=Salipaludibacillus neizhouensis TaxID=885475 RepID=A0A3A9KAB3_9BACI|nr:hypothetical protein [Salipaludibacillus neizhouensis]RKL69149.1 hypothetical protein CR203_03715 [Salipaludibacillus neizhouensis]